MLSEVKITYINKSINNDLPKIFIFAKNEATTFDALKEGVAWKVIEDIGRDSWSEFVYPIESQVGVTWNEGSNHTRLLTASIGNRYTVDKNRTGIVLEENGAASSTDLIEVLNTFRIKKGISAGLYKSGKLVMEKKVVGYKQKATFKMHPIIYWGIASEIQEGKSLSSAVLNSDEFYKLDLQGLSEVTISLNGNVKNGFEFRIENQE
ncbi:hypothetical protein PV797_01940 [Clostridiaceae bacterium M8S5]|nr:hypothetical protein PV797_01940 [Clostridiaceae bacterium M8S5]